MIERITALYARYSFDDGQESENASITHQLQLLQEYADHNGYTNCKLYADNGFSGTNFDRPDFQRMLEDVENGLIENIIVKDMSRFGRNYILVGQYVELVLPKYNVRVIGITDNYDSYNTENDMFAFENIFNEMYAADISKKVRTALHNIGTSGIELKSHPIYGYKIKDGVYYNLEIDEEPAAVIRLIYDMFLNKNMSMNKIAKHLRDNKVLKPSAYLGYNNIKSHSVYSWSQTVIKRILQTQEYCGDTINFKTKQISYKIKERIPVPREDWMVFENRQPAIISRKIFSKVQEKLEVAKHNSYSISNDMKEDTIFRQKCYCQLCNHKMARQKSNKEGIFHVCRVYLVYKECKCNKITESFLKRISLDYLKLLYREIKFNKQAILNKLGLTELQALKNQCDESEKQLQKIKKLQISLYERYYSGDLSADSFMSSSEVCIKDKEELHLKCEEYNRQICSISKRLKEAEPVLGLFERYTEDDFNELTQEMCDQLIEKVIIGKAEGIHKKRYGKRKIDIHIYQLGSISEFVDISYRKYSDRIKEIAPGLMKDYKCTMPIIADKLGCTEAIIKNALSDEGTCLREILIEVRKQIINESINKGLPMKEISCLIGYKTIGNAYDFIINNMNTSYRKLLKTADTDSS